MNKKTFKMLVAVAIFVAIVAVSLSSFAEITPLNVTANIEQDTSDTIEEFGENIMGILQTVGIVIAVVILIVLGIKYMMGSAEEKAEYKKTMMPYLIGAILIFAAGTIANVVYKFAIGLNTK